MKLDKNTVIHYYLGSHS